MSILYFLLLLGGLIFFHELGHFLVAKLSDVKVLVFSIGFGPALLKKKIGETEYKLSVIPLGGYVKMYGEDPEMDMLQKEHIKEKDAASTLPKPPDMVHTSQAQPAAGSETVSASSAAGGPGVVAGSATVDGMAKKVDEVVPAGPLPGQPGHPDFGRALNHKPIWVRSLIIIAGPVFNLVLPFIVFFFVFLSHDEQLPTRLGSVQVDGPAWKAGIRAGDTITAIDGEPVSQWWQLDRFVSGSAGKELKISYDRNGEATTVSVIPDAEQVMKLKQVNLTETKGLLRVSATYSVPKIWVRPGSTVDKAGLKTGQKVVTVDGKKVGAWYELEALLTPGVVHELEVVSPVETEEEEVEWSEPTRASLRFEQDSGLVSGEFAVDRVDDDSVAHEIGIRAGDLVLDVDGRKFLFWSQMMAHLADKVGETHQIRWENENGVQTAEFKLEPRTVKGEFNEERQTVVFGAYGRSEAGVPDPVPLDGRLSYAMYNTWNKSIEAFTVTIASVYGLFAGRVPLKDMGGPILIYEMASKTQEHGWEYFLTVMVWLSISLGVINLLPIPMMDGGHLLFFAIEAVIRRPLPLKVREIAYYIGLAFIVMLMLLVFKNDISRNWESITGWF